MIRWDQIRLALKRIEWISFFSMSVLTVVGIFFIYSACYRGDGVPVNPYYRKQMFWLVLGFMVFFSLVIIDYRRWAEQAWVIYALGLVLLLLVFIIGTKINNAYRWISFFGFQVQPSEFAKIATIIFLARFLGGRPTRVIPSLGMLFQALLIVGFPFLLIMKEPDLGTAMVLIPVVIVMLFIAGLPMRYFGMLGLGGLLMLPLAWFSLGHYQKERLLVFFDPGRDPLGTGWNKIQSQIAVGSGGLFGKGYLEGTQNVLGFLPRTVAPTDFIYSVIGEEAGFIGSVIIILLFSGVLFGCLRAATRSRDRFGRLLAAGVATMLFSHVFVNIAMTIGLMPITGLPLPLISYGGSFTISIMASLGLVQSVYVRRHRR